MPGARRLEKQNQGLEKQNQARTSDYLLRKSEVVQLGVGAEMFFEDAGRQLAKAFADFAVRVVEAAKDAGAGRAGFDTCRLFVFGDAMVTPVAFVGVVGLRVNVADAVGTCLHAVRAADAQFGVDQFNPFGRGDRRMGRADLVAGGVDALVAKFGDKVRSLDRVRVNDRQPGIGKARFGDGVDLHGSIFEVDVAFDPGAGKALGHIVFGTAGSQAFSGPDAAFGIDHKAVEGRLFGSLRASYSLAHNFAYGAGRFFGLDQRGRQERKACRAEHDGRRLFQEATARFQKLGFGQLAGGSCAGGSGASTTTSAAAVAIAASAAVFLWQYIEHF